MSGMNDLDELMRALGVTQKGQTSKPGVKTSAPKPKAPLTAKQLDALHKRLGATVRPLKPDKKAPTASASDLDSVAHLVGAKRRLEQMTMLLDEVDTMSANTLQAEIKAKELLKRTQRAQSKAEEKTRIIGELRAELQAAQARNHVLESELKDKSLLSSGARAAQAATQAMLDSLRTQTAPSPTLRQLLRARGLTHATEFSQALLLLAEPAPDLLLNSLREVPNSPLPESLRQRIVLVGPDQTPSPGSLSVSVSAERCEMGETGLQAGYSEMVQAAELAGIQQLGLVGGSVPYRKQLKHLAEGHELKLRLISGTARRQLRQAEADVRSCDVVVLWGGTELAHAVSELYRGGKVWQIAHRGLSGMMSEVAMRLLDQAL